MQFSFDYKLFAQYSEQSSMHTRNSVATQVRSHDFYASNVTKSSIKLFYAVNYCWKICSIYLRRVWISFCLQINGNSQQKQTQRIGLSKENNWMQFEQLKKTPRDNKSLEVAVRCLFSTCINVRKLNSALLNG